MVVDGMVAQPAASAAPAGREAYGRPLGELFLARAQEHAERLAIDVPGGRRYTYAELARQVTRFAAGVRALGAAPGTVVAVAGSRSAEACVALLGVVCAGAAYLPLDQSLPAARAAGMLQDGAAVAVVRLPGAASAAAPVPTWDYEQVLQAGSAAGPAGAGPFPGGPDGTGEDVDTPAYVMFTSGTTGRPKAVAVPRRGLVRLAVDNGFLDVRPTDRVLHAATLSFDASVLEMWPALLNGACLVPADSTLLLAPYALHEFLGAQRISVMFATTSVFHHIAQERPETFAGLRYVLTGGEALRPDAARRVLELGRPDHLVNAYGPTEAACVATAHQVEHVPAGATGVPIGRAISDTLCLVLREDGTEAGPGEEGELCIGGPAVAAGYLNNAAESARRFVTLDTLDTPDRDAGGEAVRVYRTGDFVRQLPDGLLEFCGRRDDQVKVRGFRIELGEITDALAAHPAVTDCVVLPREDGATRSLALYAATGPDGAGPRPTAQDLRAHLAARLPAFMVPAHITVLEQLPLAANGKVDRAALLAPAPAEAAAPAAAAAVDHAAGATVAEVVARIWADTLPQGAADDADGDDAGGDDDFFARGGNSLTASTLVRLVQDALSIGGSHSYRLVGELLMQPSRKAFTAAVEATVRGLPATSRPAAADRWLPDLDRPVPPVLTTAEPRPGWQRPRHVLLTGATGFLGAHLLRELLDRTGAEIHLLVRGHDEEHARVRLARAQARHGIERRLPHERIRIHLGDLAAPRLGLGEAAYADLAGLVDVVHHCGADVNFLYPYEQLRPANVDGTAEVIALAAARAVPVHFVSTIGVVHGFGAAGVRRVEEDTPLDHVELLSMGYTESKWVAEQLLRKAALAGLPAAVYRPHEITGDTRSHVWDSGAALCELFRLVCEMGLAPDLPVALNFVPVDHAAAAIVHLALHQEAQGQTYHLTNPREALLEDLVERLRVHGHRIDTVPYRAWTQAMTAHLADRPGHPFTPFAPRFTTLAAGGDLTLEEMCATTYFPELGRDRIERDLAGSGLVCPPVDAGLLDRYIRYFHASGFIPEPAPRDRSGRP
ncbi:amino acid adenylation domain-containing protein [Streptomyces bambusae]|uniref:Amino acid adenylation domain-containing protein n=1 Tax=Streptomyces bambusae TaxID=1550616 RepID=A0ABS6ZF98_9ACTN|nr:amino acid adenylation domain-containing protein [Streptomyces bambusae]MBW5486416.1 amino acid adenylation domain-containing protein [Streptomyces bambusae]